MEENETLTLAGAFHELMKDFKQFVHLRSSIFHIINSLWVLLSYVFREMDSVPYLYLYGPPSSGKSLLLKLFAILCFNPVYAVRITNAATYRAIEQRQTFLLDEADILAKRTGGFILAVFLNGYEKAGVVLICDRGGPGLIPFACYCMKAFASTLWIANHPLLTRCIVSVMAKPDPDNQPQRFHKDTDGKVLEELARKIRVLFEKTDVKERIKNAYLNLGWIDGISGRDDQIFSGLLAIAKVIDEELGRNLLYERVVDFARKYVEERMVDEFFGNWNTRVIISVANFFEGPHEEYDSYIVAEDLWKHVSAELHASHRFRRESLGRTLRAHSLIIGHPVIKWVPSHRGDKSRVQKTCYRIDTLRLKKFVNQHKKHVESAEIPSHSNIAGFGDIGKPDRM